MHGSATTFPTDRSLESSAVCQTPSITNPLETHCNETKIPAHSFHRPASRRRSHMHFRPRRGLHMGRRCRRPLDQRHQLVCGHRPRPRQRRETDLQRHHQHHDEQRFPGRQHFFRFQLPQHHQWRKLHPRRQHHHPRWRGNPHHRRSRHRQHHRHHQYRNQAQRQPPVVARNQSRHHHKRPHQRSDRHTPLGDRIERHRHPLAHQRRQLLHRRTRLTKRRLHLGHLHRQWRRGQRGGSRNRDPPWCIHHRSGAFHLRRNHGRLHRPHGQPRGDQLRHRHPVQQRHRTHHLHRSIHQRLARDLHQDPHARRHQYRGQ